MQDREHIWLRIITCLALLPASIVMTADRGNAFLLTTDGSGQVLDPDLLRRLEPLALAGPAIGVLVFVLVWFSRRSAIPAFLASLLVVRLGLAAWWFTVTQQNLSLLYSFDINFPGYGTVFRAQLVHLAALALMLVVVLKIALCENHQAATN